MTIAEALALIGITEEGAGEVCVVRIEAGACRNYSLPAASHLTAQESNDCYVATGRFRAGSIDEWRGRRSENLVSVTHLPFDFDLAPYLQVEKSHLHRSDQERLDEYTRILASEVREVMALCNIPVTGLVYTGYGVLALSQLADADTGRCAEARALHKALVSRINRTMGATFADPPVSDAGTRIVRIPGTLNTKNPDMPRTCAMIGEWDDAARIEIDAFGVLDYHERENRVYSMAGTLPPDRAQRVVDILRSAWTDGSRHDTALGVAAMLGKAGVNQEQAESIMWEVSDGDSEGEDRIRAVETTYHRLGAGLPASGFSRLSETLPRESLLALDAELADLRQASNGLRNVGRALPQGCESVRLSQQGGGGRQGGEAARIRYITPDEAAYAGWFGRYRDLMAPTAETPDAFHLAVALTLAGIYIGRRAHTYYFTTMYPNLYTVLVGDTGRSRKTTAIRRGKAFFNCLNGVDGYRMPFSQIRGLSTAEGLLEQLSRYSRALVEQDEFSSIIAKGKQQSSETLLPTLTELWDAPDYQQLLTRANPLLVERPTVAMISATTPQTLATDLGSRHVVSGFANRILFVYGEGKGFMDDAPPVDVYEQRGLMRDIRDAVDALPPNGAEFKKNAAASALWREMYHELYLRRHDTFDAEHMAQRVPANVHRVALIHSVVSGGREILPEHIEAAGNMVLSCFENTSTHAATWGGDDDAKLAQAVLDVLEENGEMTKAAVYRAVGQRSGPNKMWRVLESMSSVGAIRIDEFGVVRPLEGAML